MFTSESKVDFFYGDRAGLAEDYYGASLTYFFGNDLPKGIGVDFGLFNFLRRSMVLPDLSCFFNTPLDLNPKLILDYFKFKVVLTPAYFF